MICCTQRGPHRRGLRKPYSGARTDVKFFDMLDPDFYMDMFTDIGEPKALAEVQRNLYCRLVRAGSFGDELIPTCGMGQ